jgi:hypothetical protein
MDEMKNMKDFIQQHSAMFDDEEPAGGHLERFRRKMDTMEVYSRHRIGVMWLRIAALAVFAVLVSYVSFRGFRLMDSQLDALSEVHINHELNEAEHFYTLQLSMYYDKIRDLRFNNDPAEKKQVLQELSAMDEQVNAMKHDLEQNPDDERIVHAIINFYQVKIELMNVILDRAQTVNTLL